MRDGKLEFGVFDEAGDVVALNALLRSAYRALAEAGMRYAASYEDVEATRRNMSDGECLIATLDGKLVACALLRTAKEIASWRAKGPDWYRRPEVTSFGRFAVSPDLQGKGLGSKMMDRLETRAKELDFTELAIDTSERAHHLIAMYQKRGYRLVGHHQWDTTNYRSVIMSKTL